MKVKDSTETERDNKIWVGYKQDQGFELSEGNEALINNLTHRFNDMLKKALESQMKAYQGQKNKRKQKSRLKARIKFISYVEAFIAPFVIILGYIFPRKKKNVLFMGRFHSGFLDNIKYLYLHLHENGYQEKYNLYFFGYKDAIVPELKELGFKAINFPSFKAFWLLLRAGLIITDNAHWTTHHRYNLSLKIPKIQMWHGIGFKRIRLSDDDFVKKSKGWRGLINYKIPGQLAVYNTFISTSKYFTEEVFEPSFKPKELVEIGYPRNDVMFDDYTIRDEYLKLNADTTTMDRILDLKEQGKKVILYSPTFRKARKHSVSKDQIDFDQLDAFATKYDMYIVFKLHPLPHFKLDFSKYTNIIEYNSKSDIYPMFKYFDAMITDYSSIYMDYLLTDHPVFFFLYDLEYYTTICRDIHPDFMELAPGEKCMTQYELQKALYDFLILEKDEWSIEREKIRSMSWNNVDGKSAQNVWNYIESKYFKTRKGKK